jgi:uncharacterized membrane protein YbhN (UPF0104 family)
MRIARIVGTVLIVVASVGLLLWVAPPSQVLHQLGAMNVLWILAAIGLEIVSCCFYPLAFRQFFPEPPPAVARRVAWISIGAGAVLPGGDISSAATTGLLLRKHGVGIGPLASRCISMMTLMILFGFVVNGLVALWLLVGLPGGPHGLFKAGGPLLVSIIVLGAAAALMLGIRRRGERGSKLVKIIGAGIDGAWAQAAPPRQAVLGAAGYLLLDIGALWATTMATGDHIGLPAMVLAYFIGYLATLIPVPAGIGVLDSGLSGCLVLYGMHPAASVGAVLVYHMIAIWVPGTGGLIAWLPLKRRRVPTASSQSVAVRSPGLVSDVEAASVSAA